MKYDYLLKGNQEDSDIRYRDVKYEDLYEKPKWVNPLAKYENIKEDVVLNTLLNESNLMMAKNNSKKKGMVDSMVKNWLVDEKDAKIFIDIMSIMKEKDINLMKKYQNYKRQVGYFKEDSDETRTLRVIEILRKKEAKWFSRKHWVNPIEGSDWIPDCAVAEVLKQAYRNGVKRKTLRRVLKENEFSEKEIGILDTYYDIMQEKDKIKMMRYLDGEMENNKDIIKKYKEERKRRIEVRAKDKIDKLVEYAEKVKIKGKEVKYEAVIKDSPFYEANHEYSYRFKKMEKQDNGEYQLSNKYEINHRDLLFLIRREAMKTGEKREEIENFIKKNFETFYEKEKLFGDKDGTIFSKEFPYTYNTIEWYENFGEDHRENKILNEEKKGNNVSVDDWDNLFKEYDEKNKLKERDEEKIKRRYNEYQKRRGVIKEKKVVEMER